jgi:type VI secretion system protein ImpF
MPIRSRSPFRARASLIDRLIDPLPQVTREVRPLRTLTRKQLKETIRRDLAWLLNTRVSLRPRVFDRTDLTVIDYGIPDFGTYYTVNETDQNLLVQRLVRAISAFEPRLKNIRIGVEPQPVNERTVRFVLDAVIVVESVRTPVSFVTVLQEKSGQVEVHEHS